MKAIDICVQGTGAVGRALALALAGQGWDVAWVTPGGRPVPAREDVRTYALNARSVALLQRLRVWEPLLHAGAAEGAAATRVLDMRVRGDGGGGLDFSAWEQCETELAWIVDAHALEAALGEALRYAPHVTSLQEAPGAALLAVCEGAHSTAREALGGGSERHPYGQTALAARLISDRPHQGVARQWFRSPDVLALLPFDRPSPGHSYGLVWSLPQAEAQRLQSLDASAFEAELNAATHGEAGALRLGSERAVWPLALMRVERWCGPGWVLLGDAAHQVHPLAGQGLNLGLADVEVLSRILGEARRSEPWRAPGDERLLRRYARERAAPTAAMAQVTDGLLQLFAPSAAPVRELRNRGLTLLQHVPSLKRWLVGRALDN